MLNGRDMGHRNRRVLVYQTSNVMATSDTIWRGTGETQFDSIAGAGVTYSITGAAVVLAGTGVVAGITCSTTGTGAEGEAVAAWVAAGGGATYITGVGAT